MHRADFGKYPIRKMEFEMSQLTRREFAKWFLTSAITLGLSPLPLQAAARKRNPQSSASQAASSAPSRQPNVIIILADDLGYGETSVQGCKDIPTPNIDTLAANGVRFTDGYVCCPMCAPSRAGLMTGRYPQRFGIEWNPGELGSVDAKYYAQYGIPRSVEMISEKFKALGYATALFGKYHVGYPEELRPTRRGFDEFHGYLGAGTSYFPEKKPSVYEGDARSTLSEYATDDYGDRAIKFIESHKDSPFFLYYSPNAVHLPMETLKKYLKRFPDIQDKTRHTLAGMMASLDDNVGKLLEVLRTNGLEEQTLIWFLGDNGGQTPQSTARNEPLRGHKGMVYEGGFRVPFFVQWKGHLPQGSIYRQPVISLDILPTSVAAATGKDFFDAQLDGVNLLPFLSGQNGAPPHEALYWKMAKKWAIRWGDWKLLVETASPSAAPELYNLSEDISETKNLAAENPEKVAQLQTLWKKWAAQLKTPDYPQYDYKKKRAILKGKWSSSQPATTAASTATSEGVNMD